MSCKLQNSCTWGIYKRGNGKGGNGKRRNNELEMVVKNDESHYHANLNAPERVYVGRAVSTSILQASPESRILNVT